MIFNVILIFHQKNSNVRRIFYDFIYVSLFSVDEQKDNEKPLQEILSIDGVPIYFILDVSSKSKPTSISQ
jgi:hypothetical protein